MYQCTLCNYTGPKNEVITYHIRTIHYKEEALNSEGDTEPPKIFEYNEHFEKTIGEMEDYERIKWKCNECEYLTHQSSNLKEHFTGSHDKTKDFQCKECEYATSREEHLKRHVKTFHESANQFYCDQCNHVTTLQDSLKRHIKVVHANTERFRCPDCDYLTFDHGDLLKHQFVHQLKERLITARKQQQQHKQEKEYECNVVQNTVDEDLNSQAKYPQEQEKYF